MQFLAVSGSHPCRPGDNYTRRIGYGMPRYGNLQTLFHHLQAFEDYAHIYLLIEFAAGGDLRKHFQGLSTECRIRDFFIVPVLQALNILHNKVRVGEGTGSLAQVGRCVLSPQKSTQVCPNPTPAVSRRLQGFSHRDLKPENCLVSSADGKETVKLADFGLAQCTHVAEDACCVTDNDSCSIGCSSVSRSVDSEFSSASSSPAVANVAGGTPLYAAPEVLKAMFRNHGMQGAVGPKVSVRLVSEGRLCGERLQWPETGSWESAAQAAAGHGARPVAAKRCTATHTQPWACGDGHHPPSTLPVPRHRLHTLV